MTRLGLLAGWVAAQLAFSPVAHGQGAVAAASRCTSATLCNGEELSGITAKLRQALRGGEQVHILQIGDSHTSGDMISNGLRRRLQERYGNGGRGVLAAGRPSRHWLTFGVTSTESPGWISNTYFGRRWRADGPAIGLAGFTRTAGAAGEWIALTTDGPEANFDRAILCALTGPGQGTLSIRMGAREENWSLAAPTSGTECKTLTSPQPVANARLTTLTSAPVSITSFGTFRGRGGVVLSNLGVGGSHLQHFGRTSDAVLARELAAYRPDMIMVAYGTNEGFDQRLGSGYEATLRRQIARIRRLAGADVPILLLGAPDAATRSAGSGGSCGPGAFTPPALGDVRTVQRRVARELRIGFWDWEQAMGGRCASQAWVSSGLMVRDMIHFTREGGDRIGAMILADLERVPPRPGPGRPTVLPVAPGSRPERPATPPPFSHPGQPTDPTTTIRRRP